MLYPTVDRPPIGLPKDSDVLRPALRKHSASLPFDHFPPPVRLDGSVVPRTLLAWPRHRARLTAGIVEIQHTASRNSGSFEPGVGSFDRLVNRVTYSWCHKS